MDKFLNKQQILKSLMVSKITLEGQFIYGSNYTYLGKAVDEDITFSTVYKPTAGERPLYDFPQGTLSKREVAAFLVSESLGWDLVPPTIYRYESLPMGPGSLQEYIEHDPEYHFFNFSDSEIQNLRPVALFDLLINNADRKGGHIFFDKGKHLWLIDHGICFHVEEKLRTVVWNFVGEKIPVDLLQDITNLATSLKNKGWIFNQLSELLSKEEIISLIERAEVILAGRTYPSPDHNIRPYPWPPI